MKKLFYSELLDKTFDTEQECFKAEKEHKEKEAFEASKESERLNSLSKRKKELSAEIEKADETLTEARKSYKLAQNKAAEILEKSNKEVEAILKDAEEKVTEANDHKLNAIQRFNKEFGPYKTIVTGEKALDEFTNVLNSIGRLSFDRIFKDLLDL